MKKIFHGVDKYLDSLSIYQLDLLVKESQQDSWSEDSIIRELSKEYFGSDSLTKVIFVGVKLLPYVMKRLKDLDNSIEKPPIIDNSSSIK